MTTSVFHHLEAALDGVPRLGVVHVGAHRGQEVADYRRAGFPMVRVVEPNPAMHAGLEDLGVDVRPVAAGEPGTRTLYLTEWAERCSLLRPLADPVVGTVTVACEPLSSLQDGCNVAVLDVQGSELDVLRTGDLSRLDAAIVECCERRRYEGAATYAEVAEWMADQGWSEASRWGGHSSPDLVDVVWRPACA